MLQREAARKTLQNLLAGSLLAHRQRDPPLVPPTGPPTPQMRRSDNVADIHSALGQVGSRWPLLVLEEA